MGDNRIQDYLTAVRSMQNGEFRVEPPAASEDEVDLLGRALSDLGLGLEGKFQQFLELERLTERVNGGLLLEEVLDFIYESMGSVVPFNRIVCALLDEDRKTLRAVWARSDTPGAPLSVGYKGSVEGSRLEEVMRTRRPLVVNDLVEYLEEHPDSKSTRIVVSEGIRSSLTCPLVAAERAIGFLFFSSTEEGRYDESHVDTLSRVAGQLSQIIEKSRMYEELVETKRKLQRANLELERLASLDTLTGIANRRAYQTTLDVEWRRAQRRKSPLSLLAIDIDHFKSYNDRHGHQLGDECLRNVAQCLDSSLGRAGDFVARLGGEEFIAILPNTESTQLVYLAEYLRGAIAGLRIPNPDSPVEPYLTVSLGGATIVPNMDSSSARLYAAADQALYQVKHNGRNWFRVVDLTQASTSNMAPLEIPPAPIQGPWFGVGQ